MTARAALRQHLGLLFERDSVHLRHVEHAFVAVAVEVLQRRVEPRRDAPAVPAADPHNRQVIRDNITAEESRGPVGTPLCRRREFAANGRWSARQRRECDTFRNGPLAASEQR